MIKVTNENFGQEVLEAPGKVLVDFSAVWCGPCRRVAPILEEISAEFGSKVKICTVDIDISRDLAMRYGIMSVPTMYLFENGAPVDTLIGAVPKAQILQFLDL